MNRNLLTPPLRKTSRLFRIATRGAIVFLVGALAWLALGRHAVNSLNAATLRHQALGERVTIADFTFPPVPDARNAAPELTAIGNDLMADAEAHGHRDWPSNLDEYWECDDRGRPLIGPYEATLQQVAIALEKPDTDWGVRVQSPVIDTPVPHVAGQRTLAKMLSNAARISAREGDHARCLHLLSQTAEIGRRLNQPFPVTITALIESATLSLTLSALEETLPKLDFGDPAVRAAARSLATTLSDDNRLRETYRQALWFERLLVVDATTTFGTSPVQPSASGTSTTTTGRPLTLRAALLLPLFRLEGTYQMNWFAHLQEAWYAGNYPTSVPMHPPIPDLGGWKRLMIWKQPTEILLPSLARANYLKWQTCAQMRMAVVAIAIREYEADQGVRPLVLTDLVPDYLPTIPRDPFDPAGGPVRYAPDAPFPALYCLGANGDDDEGPWRPENWAEKDPPDVLFGLTGRPGRP